ncbi:MAG: BMP family protein [Intrasporangium sp.]|uniref:BMP family protein n=1 Tax=Intrasporangium sp. TaxID=1925024 RepID=UPI003F81488D
MTRTFLIRVAASVAAVSLLTAACGSDGDKPAGSSDGKGQKARIAAIFSGSTTDADYNALGLLALQDAEKKHGAETAHSESVPVPDAERVMKEYLADGYTVIWSHGSQYFEATSKLAKQYPDVTFIGEFDDKPKENVPNLWVLDRNFHTAFYPIGVLAGAATKSGKIGYVGGLSLPFSYSEVHAIKQALKDSGSTATVTPVWTGDFNDPTKAQQITSQLVGQGNDVIIGSLNLGMVGAFQAVKVKKENVLVTAKYTDKSQFDPEHYATSTIYDFTKPLDDMLTKIEAGQRNGYYPLGFESGVSIQSPKGVDAGVADKVNQAVEDIKSGKITVEKNLTAIK